MNDFDTLAREIIAYCDEFHPYEIADEYDAFEDFEDYVYDTLENDPEAIGVFLEVDFKDGYSEAENLIWKLKDFIEG